MSKSPQEIADSIQGVYDAVFLIYDHGKPGDMDALNEACKLCMSKAKKRIHMCDFFTMDVWMWAFGKNVIGAIAVDFDDDVDTKKFRAFVYHRILDSGIIDDPDPKAYTEFGYDGRKSLVFKDFRAIFPKGAVKSPDFYNDENMPGF